MAKIKLSKEQLKRVQEIQLEMLIEVDRICRKSGIRYNIIAGTLLGAVRNKGYIPWDDDADVALLRPEYEKFRKACEKELDKERFYFQDHIATDGYRWGYGKLRRKETLFLRDNQEHMPYEQGIFIDIFPLDGVPDFYPLRIVHNFACYCIRKTLWAAVGRKSDENLIHRGIYKLLYKIPEEKVFQAYDKLVEYGNSRDTQFVRILTFPTPNIVYGYKRSWYECSAIYEFEKNHFYGVHDYHQYLKFKFGDYMKLPPIEQQKTHPVSKLKLIK